MARPRRLAAGVLVFLAGHAALAAGCSQPVKAPIVFYLEGAGWYTSGGGVKQGFRQGGYQGEFQTYGWSSFLGPAHDHFVIANNRAVANGLARRIEKVRRKYPDQPINVMALSAGTAVVLNALEQLPEGITVDNVVLLSSSVSSERNLTRAMSHVRRNLYATYSSRDALLGALVANADGKAGPPAGRTGFRLPSRTSAAERAYRRVFNIPWQPSHLAFGWDGGHTSVTRADFIAAVIVPRLTRTEPFPLDRSVVDRLAVASTSD